MTLYVLCASTRHQILKSSKENGGKRDGRKQICRNTDREELQEAFAGESQARNKYTYFASVAKKEGYEQMSACF